MRAVEVRPALNVDHGHFAIDHVRGRGDFELSTRNEKPYLSGRLELFDFDLNP